MAIIFLGPQVNAIGGVDHNLSELTIDNCKKRENQLFREQLWRVVMTVPRLLDQVPGQSPMRQLEETETQVERPKCGPKEDWDERVTDAGDWKKVHHTFGSNNELFTLSLIFYFQYLT